jgi:Phytanoyl-CoA dioxygenase (PhyH)
MDTGHDMGHGNIHHGGNMEHSRYSPWWAVVLVMSIFPWQTTSLLVPSAFSGRRHFFRGSQWFDSKCRKSGVCFLLAALPSQNKKKTKQIYGKGKYDLESIHIENRVPHLLKKERSNGTNVNDVTSMLNNPGDVTNADTFVPQRTPDLQAQLQYARNGHAVLCQFLPIDPLNKLRRTLLHYGNEQELSAWRQKVAVAAQDSSNHTVAAQMVKSCRTVDDCRVLLQRLLQSDEPVPLPFLQYFNTWRTYSDVEMLAQSLAETAATLLDVPSVRLYQDALFWKRPVDGPTPWHTDARMAPFDTSHMITFWIPLQKVSRGGGGLVFCSKSHSDFALPYWNDVSEGATDPISPWNHLEKRYRSSESCCDYMPLAVGDVTVHSGWTLHCADAASEDRLALAITYVDAMAPVRTALVSPLKSDGEDVWSYQDWIHDVPRNVPHWNHPHVPILWPPPSSSSNDAPRMRPKKGRT